MRFEKRLALRSSRELIAFVNELRKAFALPKFEQDYGAGRETAALETDALSIRLLHAFDFAELHRAQPKLCPKGSNYSLHVQVKPGAPPKWDEAWLRGRWHPRWIETLRALADDGRVFVDGGWAE